MFKKCKKKTVYSGEQKMRKNQVNADVILEKKPRIQNNEYENLLTG